LEQLIDDPALLDEAPALLTDLEVEEVEALAARLEAAVAEINPRRFEPTVVPYGPRGLFLWTLLLGVAGIFVAAINWRRMGRGDLFRPTLLLGGFIYLVFVVVAVLAAALMFQAESAVYGAEFVFRIVAGFVLVNWQKPAYESWKASQPVPSGRQQRGGVVFVLTVIGTSSLTTFIVVMLFQVVVLGSLLSGGAHYFSEAGVSLTYPALWSQQDEGQDGDFGCEDTYMDDCVIILKRFNDTGMLAIERKRTLTPSSNPAVTNTLTLMGVRLALGTQRYTFDKPVVLRVGGRPALQQTGHLPSSSAILQMLLIQESPYSTVLLYSISTQGSRSDAEHEISQMIQSIEFAA
jgi:hypothetical protein